MDLIEAIYLESNLYEQFIEEDNLSNLIEYSLFVMESEMNLKFKNVLKWKCASSFSISMLRNELLNGLTSLNFSKTYKNFQFSKLLEIFKVN